ncbi:sialate O-acetylesterase [Dyadobacter sp. CY326]|uniref:sialate O-acetylesterase n=1 Tax=Dyadobacter sp. CY326 TaxID=2907300 RepID=UPI001F2F53CF|nr:sialate O-acetylesterase [Dyadobacter sp. CY326]MCE7068344.1 T9SS type A sorting domain-containing protein [Dyadobacter sp. CY326]
MDNTTHRKLLLLLFVFCCSAGFASAQRFFSVVFDKLPKDMQVYARDDSSKAEIPVSGVIELAGWDHMSLVTYRNNVRTSYQKSALSYGGKTSAAFSMKSEIKAEMADYSFEVYACHEKDSALIVKRSEVVAGDFYVVSGQSNAAATIFGPWSNKYCRTIARTPDGDPSLLPGDTLWTPAAWSWTYVGAWELELQKSILENDSIPTCVINGSLPGTKMDQFLVRDAGDPTSFTLYGSLLKRVRVAKPSRIRAFIWMHGEQDLLENISNYESKFETLYNFWKQDYPEVEQFLIIQTNLIILRGDEQNRVGGKIRDFLRRTKYIYPKTDHFSAIGTPGYDGLHYERFGYEEFGRRIYRFFAPTIYKSKDNDNVRSPDIKRAFYSSPDKKEITLIFDEGQSLTWPADSTVTGQDGKPLVLSLKNLFYLNGDETKAAFSAGKAEGNKVTLTLKEPANATKLSYLPTYYPQNLPLTIPASFNIGILKGPFLRNKRSLAAFSFDNVAIGEMIPDVELTAGRTFNSVILSWKAVEGVTEYVLERKTADKAPYELLKKLDSKTLAYEDLDFELNATYTYRIQAFSDVSESRYTTARVDLTPILGVEHHGRELLWEIYSNPVENVLKVGFKDFTSGKLTIFNSAGRLFFQTPVNAVKDWELDISKWPSGLYLLNIEQKNGQTGTQKFMKR